MLKEKLKWADIELWTLETVIPAILEGKGERLWFNYETDIKKISYNLSLYDLKLWNYLLESKDEKYLNSLKENLESKWTEIEWLFEYKWKFYLILYRPKIDWEIKIELDGIKWKVTDIFK